MRLLIVDDDPRPDRAVHPGLRAARFTVDLADADNLGLHLAGRGRYDAIIVRLTRSRPYGYRALAQLREAQASAPVLLLIDVDSDHDIAEAFDLGADEVLTQPVDLVVVVARLHALLRRQRRRLVTTVTVDDLELSPATRRVARGGVSIPLTPTEFALLEFLMRHAGTAKTKAEILDHVWGTEHAGNGNLVEAYVSLLRRKVDAPFGTETIQTVRGIGYRIPRDAG